MKLAALVTPAKSVKLATEVTASQQVALTMTHALEAPSALVLTKFAVNVIHLELMAWPLAVARECAAQLM